jgi:F-type H+-transporting ATPase subunit gamma
MKALAAASVGQYLRSVLALDDYYHTTELALHVALREMNPSLAKASAPKEKKKRHTLGALVFGSDQGLVGPFNDVIADYTIKQLRRTGDNAQVWVVGERVYARLKDSGLQLKGLFPLPTSVKAITPLIGRLLTEEVEELHLFYNSPSPEGYAPVELRLLPLDEAWQRNLVNLSWPTKILPEIIGGAAGSLPVLIREYLFVSLFRACAESLASENVSRLAAMQRADKNINDLLEDLSGKFNRSRQASIDEELFDVVAGFEALL